MRSFRHYLPGQLAETTPHQHSSTLFAVSSPAPHLTMMAQARAAVHTHVPSVPAASSVTPDIDKIWGHTVKRARQGSPLHRQTLALLDRADRLAIEAACGSWRG